MVKVLDFAKAEEIKKRLSGNGNGNNKKSNGSGLANLDALEVAIATPEEEDRERQKAAGRKVYAEKAAKTIVGARIRLRQLQVVQSVGLLTPEQETEFQKAEKAERVIFSSADEALKKDILDCVFLEDVRSAKRDRGIVKSLLAQAVKKGWYRSATPEEKFEGWRKRIWPEGTVEGFGGNVFLLNPVESKNLSDELAEAFKRAVGETMAAEDVYERQEMARLKTVGNPDICKLRSGVAGDYIVIFSGGNKVKEGVGVFSVCQREVFKGEKPVWTISVVDGAGSLNWLRENKGKFIPFTWTLKGIPEKVSGEIRSFADLIIKTINSAAKFYRD